MTDERQAHLRTIAAQLREADELERRALACPTLDHLFKTARQLRSNPNTALVYADWLGDRGDPWAELIRLECELVGFVDRRKWNMRYLMPGKWQAVRSRIVELRQQLNPFSDSVKPTWWCGLIVGVECDSLSLAHESWAHVEQPICTIKMRDWHGVERSLPAKPAEALPWLCCLQLPFGDLPSEEQKEHIEAAFGTIPNGKPCMRCKDLRAFQSLVDSGFEVQVDCRVCKGTGQGSKPRVRVEFYE